MKKKEETNNGKLVRLRLSGDQVVRSKLLLEAAESALEPEDRMQRKALETLMPHLYVLRNKGCSWNQLTALLVKSGFDLQPSSVRMYYNEMLVSRQELCQQRMNEQIILLAEVKKITGGGVDIGAVASRLAAITAKQRADAAGMIDAEFGTSAPKPLDLPSQVKVVSSPRVEVKAVPTAVPKLPVHVSAHVVIEPVSAIDVPVVIPAEPPKAAIIGSDDSGNKKTGLRPEPVALTASSSLRCLPLETGVQPLKARPGVDPAVYLVGNLEHPAMPGLLLSLEQRLASVALEFVDDSTGEIRFESPKEKRFRVAWIPMVPMSSSVTGGDFTTMNTALFTKK